MPVFDEVVLSLARMNDVIDLNVEAGIVVGCWCVCLVIVSGCVYWCVLSGCCRCIGVSVWLLVYWCVSLVVVGVLVSVWLL